MTPVHCQFEPAGTKRINGVRVPKFRCRCSTPGCDCRQVCYYTAETTSVCKCSTAPRFEDVPPRPPCLHRGLVIGKARGSGCTACNVPVFGCSIHDACSELPIPEGAGFEHLTQVRPMLCHGCVNYSARSG